MKESGVILEKSVIYHAAIQIFQNDKQKLNPHKIMRK